MHGRWSRLSWQQRKHWNQTRLVSAGYDELCELALSVFKGDDGMIDLKIELGWCERAVKSQSVYGTAIGDQWGAGMRLIFILAKQKSSPSAESDSAVKIERWAISQSRYGAFQEAFDQVKRALRKARIEWDQEAIPQQDIQEDFEDEEEESSVKAGCSKVVEIFNQARQHQSDKELEEEKKTKWARTHGWVMNGEAQVQEETTGSKAGIQPSNAVDLNLVVGKVHSEEIDREGELFDLLMRMRVEGRISDRKEDYKECFKAMRWYLKKTTR
jgi:hypothetical protein